MAPAAAAAAAKIEKKELDGGGENLVARPGDVKDREHLPVVPQLLSTEIRKAASPDVVWIVGFDAAIPKPGAVAGVQTPPAFSNAHDPVPVDAVIARGALVACGVRLLLPSRTETSTSKGTPAVAFLTQRAQSFVGASLLRNTFWKLALVKTGMRYHVPSRVTGTMAASVVVALLVDLK